MPSIKVLLQRSSSFPHPRYPSGRTTSPRRDRLPAFRKAVSGGPDQPNPAPWNPSNDVEEEYQFGGALATMVLGAALLSERLNGKGLIASLELEHHEMHPLLVFAVISLSVAALWPSKGKKAEGVMNFGRLARAAITRMAYLGLAGSIAAEMYTGRGLLALLDIETGVEALTEVEAGLAFLSMILLTNGQTAHSRK